MRSIVAWKFTYRAVVAVQLLLGGFVLLIGVALAVQRSAWWTQQFTGIAGPLGWLQDAAPIATAPLTAAVGVAALLRRMIGPPWVWRAMKKLLDRWQESTMEGRDGEPHFHRATLFRATRLWFRFRKSWFPIQLWPWSRVLVPVLRSGHLTQKCKSWFRIPDDGNCEGIAGLAYSQGQVWASNLPDVSGAAVSEEDLKRYAQETAVSLDRLRESKPRARSFFGIRIEANDEKWGVVVLDSRSTKPIAERADRETRGYALGLTVLIERKP